jgi:hypothetical protein
MNEYFYPAVGAGVVGFRALPNCCSAAFAHWVRLISTDCNCVAIEGLNILSKSMNALISAISLSIRLETMAVMFGLNGNGEPNKKLP